jgi:hypothetical protein
VARRGGRETLPGREARGATGLLALLALLALPGCSRRADPSASPEPRQARVAPAVTAGAASTVHAMHAMNATSAAAHRSVLDAGVPSGSSSAPSAAGGLLVREGSAVRASPSRSSAAVGQLWPGDRVEVAPEGSPAKGDDCDGTWVAVEPAGWVCSEGLSAGGEGERGREVFALDRRSAFPASYGESQGTAIYARVPTEAEQLAAEPGLEAHRALVAEARKAALVGREADVPPAMRGVDLVSMVDVCPKFLAEAVHPNKGPGPWGASPARGGGAAPQLRASPRGVGVAWVGECEAAGRTWLVTPERWLVARDRVARVAAPAHRGLEVPPAPRSVAFVTGRARPTYRMVRYGYFQATERTLPVWAGVVLVGSEKTLAPYTYLETEGEGLYVLADHVSRVEPAARPDGVGEDERWVDVQASKGLLVAYEGARPVYATLCSAPLESEHREGGRAVPHRGVFQIAWKRLTRSSGEGTARGRAHLPHALELEAGPVIVGDPYQPTLGVPSSGEFVRLAPLDAAWLFDWATPRLPQGWSGCAAGGAAGRGLGAGLRVRLRD